MVVTVFRSRLKSSPSAALQELGQRMYELAAAMPGFISYKDFAEDGESLAIVEFESLETLEAWRRHPEHVAAQQRGRDEFFSEYLIQVCTPVRDYSFKR
jgi:heme-degrading monooxygenase HmoA